MYIFTSNWLVRFPSGSPLRISLADAVVLASDIAKCASSNTRSGGNALIQSTPNEEHLKWLKENGMLKE